MILARTTVSCVKHLWSTVTPRYSSLRQVQFAPCWTLISASDHQKRGIFGKSKKYELGSANNFIGTWIEYKNENLEQYYKEAGLYDQTAKYLAENKSWEILDLEDKVAGKWIWTFGKLTGKQTLTIRFKMGEPFSDYTLAGHQMTGVIFQHEDGIHEKYETIHEPHTVVTCERKIEKKNKMVSTLKINDVVATKKFKRATDEERKKLPIQGP